MSFMYEVIKYQSRSAKKKSLSDATDTKVMRDVLGEDVLIGLAKLTSSFKVTSARPTVLGNAAPGPMQTPMCPVAATNVRMRHPLRRRHRRLNALPPLTLRAVVRTKFGNPN